jgi:autotransporter-associated beta strand protein
MAQHSHGTPHAETAAARGAGASWQGDSGSGGNGDWNTGADWASGSVPGATATATFATGDQGYTVTGDATIGAIAVNGDGVTFDGAITQDSAGGASFLSATNGAYVTLDENAFFTGNGLNFADGTVLEVQGTLITTGGTADLVLIDGLNADAISSGVLTVNQLYVQDGGSFTGDIALNDGGAINLDTSASFGGSTISLLGSGSIYESAAPGGDGGSGSVAENIGFAAAGGTLNLGADPSATLLVSGNITGSGSLLITGGTVELTGANTYTGGTEVQFGTLQIDTATALPGSRVLLSGGALVTEQLATGTLSDTVIAAAGTSDTVNAIGGNILAFGAAGQALTFLGGANASTVVGGEAAVTYVGGSANDAVFGGSGAVNFTGGTGVSTLVGGAGEIIANGGVGGSVIYGGSSGLDQLSTGTGNSTLVGGSHATFTANGASNSLIVVGAGGQVNANDASGNDTIFGGDSPVSILSGVGGVEQDVLQTGNATIYDNTGTSEIFGGSGDLNLVLANGFGGGTIKIAALSAGQLTITLVNYGSSEASQILASETVSGGNTYLALNDNTHVDLFGITGLTTSNFVSA